MGQDAVTVVMVLLLALVTFSMFSTSITTAAADQAPAPAAAAAPCALFSALDRAKQAMWVAHNTHTDVDDGVDFTKLSELDLGALESWVADTLVPRDTFGRAVVYDKDMPSRRCCPCPGDEQGGWVNVGFLKTVGTDMAEVRIAALRERGHGSMRNRYLYQAELRDQHGGSAWVDVDMGVEHSLLETEGLRRLRHGQQVPVLGTTWEVYRNLQWRN